MRNVLIKSVFSLSVVCLAIVSCSKPGNNIVDPVLPEPPVEEIAYFDFATTKDYVLKLDYKQPGFNPGYVPFAIYSESPVIEQDGAYLFNEKSKPLFNGLTNDQGVYEGTLNMPKYAEQIWIVSKKTGVPELLNVALNGSVITLQDGMLSTKQTSYPYNTVSVANFFALANWNTYGVPANISGRDVITSAFLDDINTTLPNSPLPQSHPEFFDPSISHKLEVIAPCEIDVTFIHEGAGWLNVLGYYVYPTGSKPTKATIASIRKYIIFPNTSYSGSGGGLYSGDKVRLKYWNGSIYSEIFPAGVTVEWVLIANGFNNSTKNITTGNFIHYSDRDLNAETNASLRQHSVLLNDPTRSCMILSFEDIKRDLSYCDQDFNDAVYSVKPTPYTAVNTSSMAKLDVFVDSDSDGVPDNLDEFPTDPALAYSTSYPGKDIYGTLSYEDLWPSQGDYDMNDLVIDYNMTHYLNKNSQIKKIGGTFNVRASGAKYKNGFGVQFNFPASAVLQANIQGNSLTSGVIVNDARGFETGHTNANIVFFDDVFKLFNSTSGNYINTDINRENLASKVITYDIEFSSAQSQNTIGIPPYNPYLIVDCGSGQRGVEVHLPTYKPTIKANTALFSTGDDRTSPSQNRYYVNKSNMPFALLIPESFLYPNEKENISSAYYKFNNWSSSMGVQFNDWYKAGKSGYADIYKLYIK
ncbi:MAG: LruC domain-containing protein [Bacteroidales bacterium]